MFDYGIFTDLDKFICRIIDACKSCLTIVCRLNKDSRFVERYTKRLQRKAYSVLLQRSVI